MRKSEIQSLISVVFRRLEMVVLLILAHTIPDEIPRFILANVVNFDEPGHQNVQRDYAEQDFVSSSVIRCVTFAVDLRRGRSLVLYVHTRRRDLWTLDLRWKQ